MAWRITGSVKGNPDFGSADVGALWNVKLERGSEKAETVVEVARTALTSATAADETRRAIRTQGKSAVKAALEGGGHPPARIICGTEGCRVRQD